MNIVLPEVPTGMLVLLALFGPYLVGMLNGLLPFVTTPLWRKVVTVFVSLILAGLVILFYYWITGDVIESWPIFLITSLLVVSLSYSFFTKGSAKAVEQAVSPSDDGMGL